MVPLRSGSITRSNQRAAKRGSKDACVLTELWGVILSRGRGKNLPAPRREEEWEPETGEEQGGCGQGRGCTLAPSLPKSTA